ncbi:MAG: hypothetical protein ACR2N4_10235 [Jatrophihabitans sp.]
MSARRATRRAAFGSLLAGSALACSMAFGLAGAGAASAMTPSVTPSAGDGTTQEVCADHLALRTTAQPNGPDQGELYYGDHVLVHSHAGNGMLYVYAYGQLNRNGYVDDGHFC